MFSEGPRHTHFLVEEITSYGMWATYWFIVLLCASLLFLNLGQFSLCRDSFYGIFQESLLFSKVKFWQLSSHKTCQSMIWFHKQKRNDWLTLFCKLDPFPTLAKPIGRIPLFKCIQEGQRRVHSVLFIIFPTIVFNYSLILYGQRSHHIILRHN